MLNSWHPLLVPASFWSFWPAFCNSPVRAMLNSNSASDEWSERIQKKTKKNTIWAWGLLAFEQGTSRFHRTSKFYWELFSPEPGRFPTCGHCLSWSWTLKLHTHGCFLLLLWIACKQKKHTAGRWFWMREPKQKYFDKMVQDAFFAFCCLKNTRTQLEPKNKFRWKAYIH